jgi:hypothetical protein
VIGTEQEAGGRDRRSGPVVPLEGCIISGRAGLRDGVATAGFILRTASGIREALGKAKSLIILLNSNEL